MFRVGGWTRARALVPARQPRLRAERVRLAVDRPINIDEPVMYAARIIAPLRPSQPTMGAT
jgi:hypothetical protein